MSEPRETFVRLQAAYRGRLGVEVGIFVAVDHLRRADRLTEDEEEVYFEIDDWFRAQLANPPFYDDGSTVGAITRFKKRAGADMLTRLEPLCEILDRHGVPWVAAETSDPGEVIYEDVVSGRGDPAPAVRADPDAVGCRARPNDGSVETTPRNEATPYVERHEHRHNR
jgi:hypothetical protein